MWDTGGVCVHDLQVPSRFLSPAVVSTVRPAAATGRHTQSFTPEPAQNYRFDVRFT